MHHPIDRIAHTTAFVTPVMEHWLEREIAQWVHTHTHHEGSIRRPIAPCANSHTYSKTWYQDVQPCLICLIWTLYVTALPPVRRFCLRTVNAHFGTESPEKKILIKNSNWLCNMNEQYRHCMWPRYPRGGVFVPGRSRALWAVNRRIIFQRPLSIPEYYNLSTLMYSYFI